MKTPYTGRRQVREINVLLIFHIGDIKTDPFLQVDTGQDHATVYENLKDNPPAPGEDGTVQLCGTAKEHCSPLGG